MPSIEEVLDELDPPLKHQCDHEGENLRLKLIDHGAQAEVQRTITARELESPEQFQVILLYAVNEIRGKGSHAPLKVLPLVDPPATK